jgi:hypothetical protein
LEDHALPVKLSPLKLNYASQITHSRSILSKLEVAAAEGIAGTDILKATTISGTMVIGLAPIFLFSRWVGHSPLSFHLAFWTGVTLGVLQAAALIPASWAIGSGKYAILLGTNLYGLVLCSLVFFLPLALPRCRVSRSAA